VLCLLHVNKVMKVTNATKFAQEFELIESRWAGKRNVIIGRCEGEGPWGRTCTWE